MKVLPASILFVPLLFLLVWVGVLFPFDLVKLFGLTADQARTVWIIVVLVYCFLASTMPVWLLLQPRDYLNSYLLYAMLALGFVGVFVVMPTLKIDAFSGFTVEGAKGTMKLFPLLFVTVACGACSGFHALVASGTTSKQLDSERNIRLVGYGCMLLEGVVALLALISVACLTQTDLLANLKAKEPVELFAAGLAGFCGKLGIPAATAKSFMLLSVAAFLMTSVDSCTRLARFTWQELFLTARQPGTEDTAPARPSGATRFFSNMYVATAVVVAIGVFLLIGNPKMAKNLWTMFASANQMLAALTLLTATLWLLKNRLNFWIVLLPMFFMLVTSGTAVFTMFLTNANKWMKHGFAEGGVTAISAAILFLLCLTLLVLGGFCLRRIIKHRINEAIKRMVKE